jgi:hypothetical protein
MRRANAALDRLLQARGPASERSAASGLARRAISTGASAICIAARIAATTRAISAGSSSGDPLRGVRSTM